MLNKFEKLTLFQTLNSTIRPLNFPPENTGQLPYKIFTIILISCIAAPMSAQENETSNRFSAGTQLHQLQNDFGSGAVVTSPFFVNRQIAMQIRGNAMFHGHVGDENMTRIPYSHFTLDVVTFYSTIKERVPLYSEGGMIGLLPSSQFPSKNFKMGGYDLSVLNFTEQAIFSLRPGCGHRCQSR